MDGMLSASDQQIMVSSFLEIAEGQTAETARQFLQATSWRLEEAIQLFLIGNEGGAGSMLSSSHAPPADKVDNWTDPSSELRNDTANEISGLEEGDEVRPPLPVKRETLYDDAMLYGASRMGPRSQDASSLIAFRNFEEEMRRPGVWESEQGAVSTAETSRDNLASLYRPPFHLLFNGTFDKAKTAASMQDKWLLVNIQSTKEFSSHMLNRDTWANEAVSQTISTNFIFWQSWFCSEDGYHSSSDPLNEPPNPSNFTKASPALYSIAACLETLDKLAVEVAAVKVQAAGSQHGDASKRGLDMGKAIGYGSGSGFKANPIGPERLKKNGKILGGESSKVYDDTTEGRKVCTYYRLDSIPVVLIIDPITGQKMRIWSGMVQPESLLEGLLPFLDAGPQDHHNTLSHKRPRESSSPPKVKVPVDLEESNEVDEEVLRRALAASMQSLEESSEIAGINKDAVSADKGQETDLPSRPSYPPLPEEPKGDRNLLCRVGVRLPDGRRVQRNFLRKDPIQLLWSFCSTQLGEEDMTKQFRLTQSIPGASKVLDYESKMTLEEAGLVNSMILLTWE